MVKSGTQQRSHLKKKNKMKENESMMNSFLSYWKWHGCFCVCTKAFGYCVMFFSCCLDNPIPFPVVLNPMWSMLKLWMVFSEKDNFLITEQFSSRVSIQMHVLFLIHFIKIIVFHSSANFTSTSDMNFVCYCNKNENILFPTQDFIGVPVNFSGWWELVLHDV